MSLDVPDSSVSFCCTQYFSKNNTDPLTAGDMNYFSSNILLALSIGAVNCFVIISGYFTIKLSLRKVVLFVLPIIFYEIVLGIAFHGLKPQGFSLLNYWFVKQYLALMLLSPVLNLGLNKLDKNKLRLLLIISFNPLAELNQCVLDSAYGFVVNVIDVL